MISVCMATYNGEKYIKEQIDSILCQIGDDDELIISDDGSTDNTISLVEEVYSDRRIKIVHNEGNHGYTPNFYNALKQAKGDYIFLSDQDDVWLPNKVETVIKALQNFNFVHSDAVIVDEKLQVISKSHDEANNVKRGFLPNLLRSRYLGCCMAFDRHVLEALFPVPSYTNTYPHDLWIALISEYYFTTTYINKSLILYRRHDSNASDGGNAKNAGLFGYISKVLIRVYYLFYIIRQGKHVKSLRGKNE